ncbi:MAG: ABC transporter ATP-binding protein, partial [Acidimicrobiia bacterium]|nr:ABC transporter ATP-binding protein [Acidimicrobiia bacterium]
ETMQVIDDLRLDRNLTVVTTMHDLTLAGQFADRLLLLNGGGILAEGTPDEVLTSETISKHYGANVRVIRDSDGGVIVVPIRTQKTMRDMNRVL